MPTSHERLTVEALHRKVASGDVDSVIIAVTDMQGRLAGKRCSARYFLDEVLGHGAEACSYLLAVDVEQNTVSGYEITSWDRGYGDFALPRWSWTPFREPSRTGRGSVASSVSKAGKRPVTGRGAVAFLASDGSPFITASAFLVGGGISGAYVRPQ